MIARDPVADHIDQVRALLGGDDDATVGDVRSIDLADDSVDAVLLLGQLYHLAVLEDRLQALAEAVRIVRPGGVVLAAGILRWAARLDPILVREAHLDDPGLLATAVEMEATGFMRPFTPAGFIGNGHTPTQFRAEIEQARLRIESLVSVEGVAFALDDLDGRMDDPERRAALLESLRLFDAEPEMLGVGMHLLATARKPNPSMRTRPAQSGDEDDCIAILAALPDYFTDSTYHEVAESLVDNVSFVAEDDSGDLLGFVLIERRHPGAAEILFAPVLPEARNTGVGTALLDVALRALAADGVALVEAKTLDASADYRPYVSTRAFWERRGFVQIDCIDPLPGWDPGNPSAIYVKALHAT